MKSLLYFAYNVKNTKVGVFYAYLNFVARETGKSRFLIIFDNFVSCLKFKIAPLDYFQFEFWKKELKEREEWAGTTYMYEYQLKMNPKSSRYKLENKIEFLNHYKKFIYRRWLSINDILIDTSRLQFFLDKYPKLVLKGSKGQVGAQVRVVESREFGASSLLRFMRANKFDLVEEYVMQHDDLHRLSPSGLNTVRVFTQINSKGEVDILGVRLRISVNSPIDNMGAGNLAAYVDVETGIVTKSATYTNIEKNDEDIHPVTGVRIHGFKIPKYNTLIKVVKEASLYDTSNLSVGWDVAITNDYVELIEGNHNWCKTLFQVPAKVGYRKLLDKYLFV